MSTFQKFEDPTTDARSQFGTLSGGAGAVEASGAGGEMAESFCAYCATPPTSTQSRNGNVKGNASKICAGTCSDNVPGVGGAGMCVQTNSATGTMRRAPHGPSASTAGSGSGEGTPSPKRCWVLVAGGQTASIV